MLLAALLLGACSDPPAPPPFPSWSGSTAPHLAWRRPGDPVRAPVVVVTDAPGGPLDRLVADPDVTTFFNDRFHPVFEARAGNHAEPSVRFYDGCGCPLGPAAAPGSAEELIALANAVVVRPEARACEGRTFTRICTPSR